MLRIGTNITLKKFDCISNVNIIPGDPLNFPDLDISNLLNISDARTSTSSHNNQIIMTPEAGRKSLLGTPFFNFPSSSSSLNALQGSDFAAVISDSDFSTGLNDHDYNINEMFSLRPPLNNSNSSNGSLEFHVPDELLRQKRAKLRIRKLKNSLMDQDLMLEKDNLFINEREMLKNNYLNISRSTEVADPIKEALQLLNGPNDKLLIDNDCKFSLFNNLKLKFTASFINAKKQKNNNNKANESFHPKDINMNDDFNYDVEQYRNDTENGGSVFSSSNTPSNLILPWSSSSDDIDMNHFPSSAIPNTPSRKGPEYSSPFSDLQALRLSSSSSTSFSATPSSNPATPSPFPVPRNYNNSSSNDFISTLSKETFDFYYFLQDAIIAKTTEKIKTTPKSSDQINANALIYFTDILKKESTRKPIAARALHHLLELKTANLITVKQIRPYSEIQISID